MKKKLIEVSLPLDAINSAAADEKGNPFLKGHPRALHQWWARRPQTAARAIIFAQMVDDPSSHPDLFPTLEAQDTERKRLFGLIEGFVAWEDSGNEAALGEARNEIWKSWRKTCEENKDDPRAKGLFNPAKLPMFHDPFAGGGALPLEAQRLGLEVCATDLNPVSVLICKAAVEIPARFHDVGPINPSVRSDRRLFEKNWRRAEGLAEDLRFYSRWVQSEAKKQIGALYPKVAVTAEMAKVRPDLRDLVGSELSVIAYVWARTVKSPNPAFAHTDVPLVSTFLLSAKPGRDAYIEPVVENDEYHFVVKTGKPPNIDAVKRGTKLARGANFGCLLSGSPIEGDYIKAEGKAGRIGKRLMAVVAEGNRKRVYLTPMEAQESAARNAIPTWRPEGKLVEDARAFTPYLYGISGWSDLFTERQLVALEALSGLLRGARSRVIQDAIAAGMTDDGIKLDSSGNGATAYGDAIAILLALCVDKMADYNNAICAWNPTNENVGHLFTKQVIPMAWDFVESSPFEGGLAFEKITESVANAVESLPGLPSGTAFQADAAQGLTPEMPLVFSTDPPYYDNVPYADLSDFFYVWLRRSLKDILPGLFGTLAVPKNEELVASSYRHGGRESAELFFLEGMTLAMSKLAKSAHPAFPVAIYYAFKQAEDRNSEGSASTGWETFLAAVIRAGLGITGTWPIRTERATRSRGLNSNALASSIVLVCQPRPVDAPTATRREFVSLLKVELAENLSRLQRSNIAPVDLAQAAIGPGMSAYTRYSKVLDASGQALSVRDALALINQILDEVLAEQEGDFDSDSRWALAWFEQLGFVEGEFGVADTLSKAKNTSVKGMADSGILVQGRGKVRLLRPAELPKTWDPENDDRLSVWEIVHHLVSSLETGGENSAAVLVAKLGHRAEVARELAYRLYAICERKKWAQEALAYNSLVQSWPEIMRIANQGEMVRKTQTRLFGSEQE